MKKLLAAFLMLPCLSYATPYFRAIDPAHIHQVAGVFIDPVNPGSTSVGSAVALVTHSVSDGCLLPSVVCEDWSPILIGMSVNAGRVQLSFGPGVNLTPLAKLGLLSLLNQVTKEDSLGDVKSALGSQPIAGPDVSMSFGPALALSPIQHGVIIPMSEYKGRLQVFAGASLKF